jgi:predicted DNA-binding ribbon-helix-helix protein
LDASSQFGRGDAVTIIQWSFVGKKAVKSSVRKRSIFFAGYKTSVSLEDEFWKSLKEIASERGMTLGELVRTIDANRTMPIYRQLFDFLCLASIAISVAEASRGRRVVQAWAGLCSDHR